METQFEKTVKALKELKIPVENVQINGFGEIVGWVKDEPKDKTDLNAVVAKYQKEYTDLEYSRKRLEEYNAIGLGEQLDMIYHDIDGWKAKIKSVKDKFPKP